MKAQFSQKITGERKAVMAVIAGITQTAVTYTKAPRFAYEAGRCSIDRAGVLWTPVFPIREAEFYANLTKALAEEGFAAEGALSVAIYPDGSDPGLLGNIQAVLSGKATLIRHALGTQNDPCAQLAESGFLFPFFPAALRSQAVLAAVQFSALVHGLAASHTRVRTKDVPVPNEKYAMRCFLLRLGMIGPEYAISRRELLSRLAGDSSFKSGPRPLVAPESAYSADDSLAEALADAELIHGVNALLEAENAAVGPAQGDCLACAGSMSEPGEGCDRLFCVERQEYVPEDGSCNAFNR